MITVVACGEKCILECFNKKIQRKSAPERRKRRGKDNIKMNLKYTVTMFTVFNRFGKPSSSITSGELIQKLSDHKLMTSPPRNWFVL